MVIVLFVDSVLNGVFGSFWWLFSWFVFYGFFCVFVVLGVSFGGYINRLIFVDIVVRILVCFGEGKCVFVL